MKINGLEGLSREQISLALNNGARFVTFYYCVSILIMTFRRSSDVYFVRQGDGTFGKGLPFTLLSLIAGWWGIPWGPIYTIQSIFQNSTGGVDMTGEVRASLGV